MEFCDKCGGMIMPKKGLAMAECRNCGKKKKIKNKKDLKVSTVFEKHKEQIVVVVEKKKQFETLPKTEIECPECGNREAYWWMQQTRSGDEAPTRFHKCVKCNHVWREYE